MPSMQHVRTQRLGARASQSRGKANTGHLVCLCCRRGCCWPRNQAMSFDRWARRGWRHGRDVPVRRPRAKWACAPMTQQQQHRQQHAGHCCPQQAWRRMKCQWARDANEWAGANRTGCHHDADELPSASASANVQKQTRRERTGQMPRWKREATRWKQTILKGDHEATAQHR